MIKYKFKIIGKLIEFELNPNATPPAQQTSQTSTNQTHHKSSAPPIQKHIEKHKEKKSIDKNTLAGNPMSQALPRTKNVNSYASLMEYVRKVEGMHLKAYWDIKQYSICTGVKSYKGEVTTETDCMRRLKADLAPRYNKVKRIVAKAKKPLNASYVYALTDFAFNLGFGALYPKGNNLGKAIRDGNRDLIKSKMLQYCKARNKHGKLVVLRGLQKRRQDEVSWLTDDAGTPEPIPTSSNIPNIPNTTNGTSPMNSYSSNTGDTGLVIPTKPISQKVISEQELNFNILEYNVVKSFDRHFNIHRMLISDVTSDIMKLLSNKSLRLELTLHDENNKIYSVNLLKIKDLKTIKRQDAGTFVVELILINHSVDLFMRINSSHVIMNGVTTFDALKLLQTNFASHFTTNLTILTNGSNVDVGGSSKLEMFKLNKNFNSYKYEQIVIPQLTPFEQLDVLINNHYNLFNSPCYWLLDDAVFSPHVNHDIVLYLYDPTQNQIMIMNTLTEATSRTDATVTKIIHLFDKEVALKKMSQNFVLNKPNGFFVDNNNSHSTAEVILTDSIDQFNIRKENTINWIKSDPLVYTIELKDIDVSKVRQMEQFDTSGNGNFDSTILNTITTFKQEQSDTQQEHSHDIKWIASQVNQFYVLQNN